ncbi:MAG: tetratricopeptide repeat protein [Rickettsiaceae bacterium]|nr:tetratricopeptide repeat protein [Rickettsiaceae bacterium]
MSKSHDNQNINIKLANVAFTKASCAFKENNLEQSITEYNKAIKIYQQILQVFKDCSAPQLDIANIRYYIYHSCNALGVAEAAWGKFEDALRSFEKAEEQRDDLPQLYFNKAFALLKMERYQDSENAAIKSIELYQKQEDKANIINQICEAHNIKAQSQVKQGRIGDAIISYQESIEFSDSTPQIFLNKGVLEVISCGKETANYSFDRAVNLSRAKLELLNVATLFFNQAAKYFGEKNNDLSLYFYNKTIDIINETYDQNEYISNPQNKVVMQNILFHSFSSLGNIYATQNDYNKSVEFYLKALEYNSNTPQTFHNIGFIYNLLGKYEESADYFSSAIGLYTKIENKSSQEIKDLSEAYLIRSGALSKIEKIEECAADLRDHIKLMPENAEAYLQLGQVLEKLNQNQEACEVLSKASELLEAQNNQSHLTQDQSEGALDKIGELGSAIGESDQI